MSVFPAKALWPTRERAPLLRLCIALLAAPVIVAGVFSLFTFVIAGMTETSAEAVWRVTLQSALTLSALVFAFTLTFGVAGVAVLWRMARRGTAVWALAGAVAGTVAGVLFSLLAMPGLHLPLVIAFALSGWALFLLIRLFAGVRAGPVRRSA